ncbi:MAG: hypothetical protein WC421_07405 [Elusimicrobiales bacterium]
MIRNPHLLRKLDDDIMRLSPPDYGRNIRIYEAMREEAVLLGVLPLRQPLDGIEDKINLALAINHVSGTARQNSR